MEKTIRIKNTEENKMIKFAIDIREMTAQGMRVSDIVEFTGATRYQVIKAARQIDGITLKY